MAAPLRVVLYRSAGCGLCDAAEAMLARIARRLPIVVEAVDIGDDPALGARYVFEIPVIEAEGRVIARAPVVEAALAAELEALLEERSGP
jgi:thiol-disulfide isomerase/thioredoxin